MTQTDCDALVKIFKELKYNYVHNYSGYSCWYSRYRYLLNI